MSMPEAAPARSRWLIAAIVVTAVSVLGLASPENLASSGLTTGSDGSVSSVTPGGAAESAGIEVGDRVLAIDGLAFDQTVAQFKRPRPAIGDTRTYTIDRDGERSEIALRFARAPASTLLLFLGAIGVGLVFLIAGLDCHLRRPSDVTRLAALLGLSAMIAFGLPPYLPNVGLRLALTIVLAAAGTAMLPLLLELVLRFPADPPLRRAWRLAIYLPIALLVAFFTVAITVAPGLAPGINALGAMVPAAYALAIAILAIARWRRAKNDDRRLIGVLAAAVVLGLVPLIVGIAASNLPGASFYFLSIAALPLAIAYGLRRRAGGGFKAAAVRPVEV